MVPEDGAITGTMGLDAMRNFMSASMTGDKLLPPPRKQWSRVVAGGDGGIVRARLLPLRPWLRP